MQDDKLFVISEESITHRTESIPDSNMRSFEMDEEFNSQTFTYEQRNQVHKKKLLKPKKKVRSKVYELKNQI